MLSLSRYTGEKHAHKHIEPHLGQWPQHLPDNKATMIPESSPSSLAQDRKFWKYGEADLILNLARKSQVHVQEEILSSKRRLGLECHMLRCVPLTIWIRLALPQSQLPMGA
jgi:hypothetical protein